MTLKEWVLDIEAIRDEAKAIWGNGLIELTVSDPFDSHIVSVKIHKLWRHHLSAMLNSDDPEKYLRENTR